MDKRFKKVFLVPMLAMSVLILTACSGGGSRSGDVYYQSMPGSSPWRGYYYRPVYIDSGEITPPETGPDNPEAVPLPEPPDEIPDFGAPDIDFGDY